MSETTAPPPASSPWILGPVQDLLLFVATPLLIVPVAMIALLGFESRAIQYFVLAFGAMGHNLPGMLRAYGDRALFERFRTRFILAPIVFVAISLAFALRQSQAIVLIAFFWAAWHALMQVYGFLRIYDAKVGAVAPRIARLDLAMVIGWFGGAIVLSDARMFYVQEIMVGFGVSPMTPGALEALRWATAGGVGLVTLAFLVNQALQQRAGVRSNPIKNLLMFTSIGFWWYAHFITSDVLLGLIMFEVFHDVQYLAIVWIFNRRRVDADPSVGGFTRFVFRNSWGMIGLYVGMVLAYGAFIPLSQTLRLGETGTAILAALIVSSALLHYYFDGFIWKVRERSTRKGLGLDDGSGGSDLRVPTHALKWLLFLVPCGVLWFADERSEKSVEQLQALAISTPNSSQAQFRLGEKLNESGRHRDSLAALEKSLAILPDNEEVRLNLSLARLEAAKHLMKSGQDAEAEQLVRLAYAHIPDTVTNDCNDRGLELRDAGKLDDAIAHFKLALLVAPEMAIAHLNLALAYRDAGRRALALQHARQGAALRPGDPRAQQLVRSLQER